MQIQIRSQGLRVGDEVNLVETIASLAQKTWHFRNFIIMCEFVHCSPGPCFLESLNGDAGKCRIGFHEVWQRTLRLVPCMVIAMLDFADDAVIVTFCYNIWWQWWDWSHNHHLPVDIKAGERVRFSFSDWLRPWVTDNGIALLADVRQEPV